VGGSETLTTLYRDDTVAILDLDCCVSGSDLHERALGSHAVAFVHAGFFVVETERERFAGQANHAVCFERDAPFLMHHPVSGGDHCTIITTSEPRAAEMTTRRRTCPAGTLAGQVALVRDLRSPIDPFEVQERALGLVASLFADELIAAHERASWVPLALAAEEMIASHYREPLGLEDVARAVGASPFHLSRAFRAVVGIALHAYVRELRLRAALDHLSADGSDLARLAHELGFSDASHMTHAFKQSFGATPSQMRKDLQARHAGDL
jgi:AraC-like DNA-binding protein